MSPSAAILCISRAFAPFGILTGHQISFIFLSPTSSLVWKHGCFISSNFKERWRTSERGSWPTVMGVSALCRRDVTLLFNEFLTSVTGQVDSWCLLCPYTSSSLHTIRATKKELMWHMSKGGLLQIKCGIWNFGEVFFRLPWIVLSDRNCDIKKMGLIW